jgi:hypothetical protein
VAITTVILAGAPWPSQIDRVWLPYKTNESQVRHVLKTNESRTSYRTIGKQDMHSTGTQDQRATSSVLKTNESQATVQYSPDTNFAHLLYLSIGSPQWSN